MPIGEMNEQKEVPDPFFSCVHDATIVVPVPVGAMFIHKNDYSH